MFIIKLAVLVVCFAAVTGNNYESYKEIETNTKALISREDFIKFIVNKLLQTDFVSKPCKRNLAAYVSATSKLELWPIKMFDATGKLPAGLLRGYTSILGNFDECLSVESPVYTKWGQVKGKYCLGTVEVGGFYKTLTVFGRDLGQLLQPRMLDIENGTFSIQWGFCFPDSCSIHDFNKIGSLLKMKFTENLCQTKDDSTSFDDLDIAAIVILISFAVLVFCSTVIDVFFKFSRTSWANLLRAFSLKHNITTIMAEDKCNAIPCLHGIRVLNLIFILGGFRFIVVVLMPETNWMQIVDFILDKDLSAIIEFVICGDTFVLIAGLLISYNYLQIKEANVKFNIILYYLNRIVRLTPALAMAVLLHASLLRHIGSGPVWPDIREYYLVNNCRDYWWSSLLYVQNYVNPYFQDICITQTWQLSLDMQLFILSPLLLFSLRKHPKYTMCFILFLILCTTASSFLVAWVYKLKAVFRTTQNLDDFNRYMRYYYFPIHTRAGPWLFGFLTGYIIHQTTQPNIKIVVKEKISKLTGFFLWFIAVLVLPFCIMIGRYLIDVKYDWLTHALHIAFIRPFWSIAICWIIFAFVHGFVEPVNLFMSSGMFRVLSRISYSTYIVCVTLMIIISGQTRTGVSFSIWDTIDSLLSDIMLTFLLGFVWALVFEYPFVSIIKTILIKTNHAQNPAIKVKSEEEKL